MARIIILTGNELRHQFFRSVLENDTRFEVITSICEGVEQSLNNRTNADPTAGFFQRLHVEARAQSEIDFFGRQSVVSRVPSIHIAKGAINEQGVVNRILDLTPDLLVCYGSSIVRSPLLDIFLGRFINVHLGLSPYYRGSGTNVWPMINRELHMVGATFMQIDKGIDTGEIIHQIRADVVLGDGPHSVGNRLIAQMTTTCANIIAGFNGLTREAQPTVKGRIYRKAEWGEAAAKELYDVFRNGLVEDHLINKHSTDFPNIITNAGFVGK
jgi:phosphoribosylglycinamide formyltransferase 1